MPTRSGHVEDPQRMQRIEEVFLAAVACERTMWDKVLEERCAGDTTLRQEVETLLANHETDDHVLDTRNSPGRQLLTQIGMGPLPEHEATLPPNRKIGRYTILGLLGSGGMGVVYVAEQEQPKRTVALKVLRAGMWGVGSERILRRFEYEGEILGKLKHPGIALVYEAGTERTEHGTFPFIAMELVRGKQLTEHARSSALNVRERMELVARIADAVHSAHLSGVIHRDLKPANILVQSGITGPGSSAGSQPPSTLSDSTPHTADRIGEPKILDFGVARMVSDDNRSRTMQTGAGQLIGTLPYMSPEQVSADTRAVDVRTDVYTLGVILFELLTGHLPHELGTRSLPELARIIRDDEPARITRAELEPGLDFGPELGGDIVVIVAKALAKDVTRRYQSAADLAADIRRSLQGLPILSRNDSALYVLRRQLWRYRWIVGVSAVFVAGISAAGIWALIEAANAGRAAKNATSAYQTANAARNDADAAAIQLRQQLAVSRIDRGRLEARLSNMPAATELLWKEHLAGSAPVDSYWALWDLYQRSPWLSSEKLTDHELVYVTHVLDQQALLTAGIDGVLRLWDRHTHAPLGTLTGHTGPVFAISASPDGKRAISAGDDGRAMLWNLEARSLIATVAEPRADTPVLAMKAAAYSRNGRVAAFGGYDGKLRFVDGFTGTILRELSLPGQAARGAYSPDGKWFAIACSNGKMLLYSVEGGLPVGDPRPLVGHNDNITHLLFSIDGKRFFSGGREREIKVWNVQDAELLDTLRAPNNTIRGLCESADGKTLFTGGWLAVQQWNLTTKRIVPKKWMAVPEPVAWMELDPSGSSLVAVFGSGQMRVLDLTPTVGRYKLPDHQTRACAATGPDGRVFATGDGAGLVRLWETRTGELLAELRGHRGRVRTLRFHPTKPLLFTAAEDGARMWDLTTGDETGFFKPYNNLASGGMGFSPDGSRVVVPQGADAFRVLSVPTLRPIESVATMRTPNRECVSAQFSPDGESILTVSRANAVCHWSAADGSKLSETIKQAPWWGVYPGPSIESAVVGTWAGYAEVFDRTSGATLMRLEGHNGLVSEARFRAGRDGAPGTIITGCADGIVRFFDLQTKRCVVNIDDLGTWDVTSIALTPDERTLIVADGVGTVFVYDLEYVDRHIAGNIEAQAAEHAAKGDDATALSGLRRWAAGVIDRPWPRLRAGSAPDLPGPGKSGIDPALLRIWSDAHKQPAEPADTATKPAQ